MENKEGQGAIFKNEKKSGNAPDYRGKVMINGQMTEIALWVKESKKGVKYFSVSQKNAENEPRAEPKGDDDGLPF